MAVNETQLVQLFEQVLTLSKVDASQSVAILKKPLFRCAHGARRDRRGAAAGRQGVCRRTAGVQPSASDGQRHDRLLRRYRADRQSGGAACAGGRRPDRRYHDAAAFAGAGTDPENRHPHPAGGGAAGGAGAHVAQRGGQGAGAGHRRRAGAGEADAGNLRRRQRFPRAAGAIPDGDRVRLCR